VRISLQDKDAAFFRLYRFLGGPHEWGEDPDPDDSE
jgi:hypothetical protein